MLGGDHPFQKPMMELPLLWFMLACPSGAGALGRGSVVPCAAAREAGNGHGPLLPSPCAAQKLPPLLSIQKPAPPFLCVKFKELKLIWLVWDFFSLSCQPTSVIPNCFHTKLCKRTSLLVHFGDEMGDLHRE